MKKIVLGYFFIISLFTCKISAESNFLYVSPGVQIGINSKWKPFYSAQITFGHHNTNETEYLPGLTIGVRWSRKTENGWSIYKYYDAQVSWSSLCGGGFGMIHGENLLPILFITFWACEDEEKVREATPVGTWNLVSRCEYDYGDCTVNCTEEELKAYCGMEDNNSFTAPDNEAECNNLNGYWVKELTSILTINDNIIETWEISGRYGDEYGVYEDEFYNVTLVENSTGGYLVNIENVIDDSTIEVFLTLSDNGESLSIQIIADLGQDDCRLYTFTKE